MITTNFILFISSLVGGNHLPNWLGSAWFITLLMFVVSLIVSYISLVVLIPRLKRAGIFGKDLNKPTKPEVAEMGGFGIISGFAASIFLLILLFSFFGDTSFLSVSRISHTSFSLISIIAVVLTVFSVAFIGIIDDLISLPQWVKALLPLLAATPLVALRTVGSTSMVLPIVGTFDFGLFYLFILAPVGIAVASNLTNMLAGFNGMEAGMGIVMMLTILIVGFYIGNINIIVLSVAMLGALVGFILLNWYPAKVFPGDVGTLAIGATVASIAIIGNMESICALLMIPYVIDFFIKLVNRFPSSNWWGNYKDGKLYASSGRINGFAQYIMKITKGISEINLTLFFIGLELIDAVLVLFYFFFL